MEVFSLACVWIYRIILHCHLDTDSNFQVFVMDKCPIVPGITQQATSVGSARLTEIGIAENHGSLAVLTSLSPRLS